MKSTRRPQLTFVCFHFFFLFFFCSRFAALAAAAAFALAAFAASFLARFSASAATSSSSSAALYPLIPSWSFVFAEIGPLTAYRSSSVSVCASVTSVISSVIASDSSSWTTGPREPRRRDWSRNASTPRTRYVDSFYLHTGN